ncbi:MAG: phosphate ABC transporter permease PstA [Candidatus Altiarchaeota archaeon]|nr:phosphate ABC transporter permease PstA [Candidatus Altiarchaeota archaeon]
MNPLNSQRTNRIAITSLWVSAVFIIMILVYIILYVFLRGLPAMSLDFLFGGASNYWLEGGIFPAMVGTLLLAATALSFAIPIGVGSAIYLSEFTKEGKVTKLIRTGADSLNAVPSIVFGLFGLTLFLFYLKMKACLLVAGLTLGFMILPTIMRTAEVAIRTVPGSDKEGSYALGATKLQTIRRVVLPSALPGIVTGVILGFGRAVGETAPIIWLVSFWPPSIPTTLLEPANALTVIMYFLILEAQNPLFIQRAFGIALVLLLMILISNYVTRTLNAYLTRNIRR